MFDISNIKPEQMIDRRSKLTYREFMEEYVIPSKPVILTDLMDDWPAKTKWTLEFFKSKYGSMIVPAREGFDGYELELGEYIDYITQLPVEEREFPLLYMRDWIFSDDAPELLDDYKIPRHFKSLLRHLPETFQKPYRWLYLGPEGTGTTLHIDIDMTHAWNAVFCGQKHWIFYSPDQKEHVYNGRVNAFDPDYEKYPLFAEARPLYGVHNAGEILFTPSGWWHQVRNTETTLALTESYVDKTNYEAFMRAYTKRFLKNR